MKVSMYSLAVLLCLVCCTIRRPRPLNQPRTADKEVQTAPDDSTSPLAAESSYVPSGPIAAKKYELRSFDFYARTSTVRMEASLPSTGAAQIDVRDVRITNDSLSFRSRFGNGQLILTGRFENHDQPELKHVPYSLWAIVTIVDRGDTIYSRRLEFIRSPFDATR